MAVTRRTISVPLSHTVGEMLQLDEQEARSALGIIRVKYNRTNIRIDVISPPIDLLRELLYRSDGSAWDQPAGWARAARAAYRQIEHRIERTNSMTEWVPGDLVRLNRGYVSLTRKVALVVGPSRNPKKIRVKLWQHSRRAWSSARAEPLDNVLGYAPTDWSQTRAAVEACLKLGKGINDGR